ncbi:Protein of unknown function [Pseudonocardia thermophila]|uniref:DUF3105 domain-containing protein n=1 Tax=Pseudonocardia thermophila TaxID=1848 RepID=A0A1M6QCE7_PSETH|nr:DUF3105 domain-containing protein [Pseudonocardia thermophila]SHK17846.1 Protein of unknown function [Pseudonocardia thermophila]
MASGKTSKAARRNTPAPLKKNSFPWGTVTAVVVLVAMIAVIGTYVAVRSNEQQARAEALAPFTPTAQNPDPSRAIPGIVIKEYPGGSHVGPDEQVAYTESPPFGGTHDQVWAACNGVVYDTPVRSENLVHSLEHGAVWIAYHPDRVSGEALETLKSKVTVPYTVMSPYPDLDRPISLQSWGHQLKLDDANDPRIDQFIAALRLNPNTHPEPNASCQETTLFDQHNPPPYQPAPTPGTPGARAEDESVDPSRPMQTG